MLGVLFQSGKAFIGMLNADNTSAAIVTRKHTGGKVVESIQVATLEEMKALKKVVEDTIFEMEYLEALPTKVKADYGESDITN